MGQPTDAPSLRQRVRRTPAAVRSATTRQEAIIEAAGSAGLLTEKTSRISGRVSRALVERAKRATGLDSDTALIEFALSSVALDDHFAQTLIDARGSVDPDLKLGL